MKHTIPDLKKNENAFKILYFYFHHVNHRNISFISAVIPYSNHFQKTLNSEDTNDKINELERKCLTSMLEQKSKIKKGN